MKTKNLKTKALSILLSLVMLFSMLPMTAFAADSTTSYVALGDSISTGYGLANKTTEGFTYLLADELGYELTNLAVDGNTAFGILSQLTSTADETVLNVVKDADLITITVGGNDLMALLYQGIANLYNATQTDDAKKINASDITTIMSDPNDSRRLVLTNYALRLLNPSTEDYLIKNPTFTAAVNVFVGTLNQIMAAIFDVNPDATVIVATQYNPYVEYNGAFFANFINLSPIYQGMEAGVTALNTAIKNNSETGGYIVADVKAEFDRVYSDTNDLYVADPTTLELDFHPNAAGHTVIAETFAKTVPTTSTSITVNAAASDNYYGTVSGSGTYNVGDSVTLTATPVDGSNFEYWLDASVQFDDDPTEAELRNAIVSYDATYTFAAAENVSLEAVFSSPVEIGITPMLIAGTDAKDLLEAEWMDVEYDFGSITPGAEHINLPGEIVKNIVTIGDKQYKFAGFIVFGYDEETDTETVELKQALTIGAMPLYGSAEYFNWFAPISDGVFATYMEYTPEDDDQQNPENPDNPQNPDDPQDPDDPQKPTDPDSSDDPQNPNSPQTGDNSHMTLWLTLLFISGGALIVLIICDRKRRNTVKF